MDISLKLVDARSGEIITESILVKIEFLNLILSSRTMIYEGVRYSTGDFYAGIGEASILKVSPMARQF